MVLALGTAAWVVPSSAGASSAGDLVQLVGPTGCVSETGSGGACSDGVALRSPLSVVVAPDGQNAYATSNVDHAVLVFDRDPATGALTQKPSPSGCISDTGSGGQCVDGRALEGVRSVVVSPDGDNVYAVGHRDDSIVVFDRDPVTGALRQKAGEAGCASESGADGCADGTALVGAHALALSPDGASAYVASYGQGAVAVFDRDIDTGALIQKAGAAGCHSGGGTGGCTAGVALGAPTGIAVSPDGGNVYVAAAGPDAVVAFDRDPVTGSLAQLPGTSACTSSEGLGGPCAEGVALQDVWSVAVSPDGRNLYAASPGSNGLAVFDRDPIGGALVQAPGTAGCTTTTGGGGACTVGIAVGDGRAVAVTPDGAQVFLVGSESVAVFDRHPSTGALLQETGAAACASATGSGGACTVARGVEGAFGLGLSPDGRNLYVAGTDGNALAVFDVVAPGTPFRRPDLEVRKERGDWLGAGVLDEDGTGQTVRVSRERSGMAILILRVRNRALVADRFRLAEVAPPDPRVHFRYLEGRTARDVTDAVRSGTYRTRSLAPGQAATVRVEVFVGARARHDTDFGVALRAASKIPAVRTDTVAAVVHVY